MMDEQTLLARATEERERLFQRYERGREPGAEIDPWEDPGFEVYHQTDRYGFIHDKRLPQKIDPNEAKSRAIEMERVKKWLKMVKKWNSKDTQEKLHKRIYKGIPDKLRSQVWMKLLNIDQIMAEKKDVYQNMLKLARQWSTEARQIDSDVNRQFREHLFYRERYSIKQRSLYNVLTAYSMYNMEVGYCQGMSGVAGVLLMYMDEEEAFWALSTLLADKKYAMHGLYIEGFPKLNRLVHHHDRIIEKFLPKIKKHFDLHNLDSMIYSLKWFFVIFIERIPFSLCLRVWDIYLKDGERVVSAMAYTILRLHQKKLIKLKDMDLLVQYLQTKLHKDFGYDDDYVIKTLEQSMEELRKSKLDLAGPAPETEFPKRPFGLFVEPTAETKIGRRKSAFTETEKEVTENVLLRREQTQQQLTESRISDGGLGGSNSQLNTDTVEEENWEFMRNYKALPSRLHVRDKRLRNILDSSEQYSSLPTRLLHGNIPESEDGGSLLGSSRKSLADTSVTSTADLSVFSTGQRSQQFDICVDDTRSMHSDAEGEGESSPGSAFGSLSIVGRTPSAMMITPTPRAISPHDIVRIYVPPAPPDEKGKLLDTTIMHHTSSSSYKTTPETINKQNISVNSNNTEDSVNNSSNSGGNGGGGGSSGSNRNSIISGEVTPIRRSFVYKSDEELTYNGQKSSSSSRRGSLSRKSPSILMETNVDCEHLRTKRRSIDISDEHIDQQHQQQHQQQLSRSNSNSNNSNEGLRRSKLMTSFEELARLRKEQSQKYGYNVDTRMTRSVHAERSGAQTSDDDDLSPKSKYDSDCNIQYRALATSPSPIDNDFIQSDIKEALRKKSDNSDEYSSSSPNTRSVLTTPVNEQMPSSIMTSSISTQKLLTSGETTPTLNLSNPTGSGSVGGGSISGGVGVINSGTSSNINLKNLNRFSAPTPIESNRSVSGIGVGFCAGGIGNISSTSNSSSSNNFATTITGINISNNSSNDANIPRSITSGFRPRVYSNESSSNSSQQYADFNTRNFETTTTTTATTQNTIPNDLIGSSSRSNNISSNIGSISRSEISGKMKSIEFDHRIAAPIGGPYDYKNTNPRETNKIRIKVHQNQ